MKKIITLLIALSLLILISACKARDNGSAQSSSSQVRESQSEYSTESDQDTTDAQNKSSAVFGLGLDGENAKTMSVGDRIGDWTLSELEIEYKNGMNNINSLFIGNVTLNGRIAYSAFENRLDFLVSKEDESKMPCYISDEIGERNAIYFMPDIFADDFPLEEGGEKDCVITISSYRFFFSFTTAPAIATVVDIEIV